MKNTIIRLSLAIVVIIILLTISLNKPDDINNIKQD